ncbi:hypothetical protein FCM67_04170, partial [Mycoplasma bovis]|nr:hypothetical protein [Mycoplasmopsis bovis]
MTNNKLDEVFNESFMSVESPELKLGKNNVSSLIKWIGKDYSKVLEFIQNRVNKIDKSNKIAIDGMLKNNNSKVNSLNDFSYKSKLKNSKNISILIAFNVTTRDVICSLPYSGNCVDVTSFPDFLEKTGINKGIIIGDKGINSSALMSNVGFIHPLKRPLKLLEEIDAYNMKDKIN